MRPSRVIQLAEAFLRLGRQQLGAPVVPVPTGQCSGPEQAMGTESGTKKKRVQSQERLSCPSLPTTHGAHRRDLRASEGLGVPARLATEILHSSGGGVLRITCWLLWRISTALLKLIFFKRSIFSGTGCLGLFKFASSGIKTEPLSLVCDISIHERESYLDILSDGRIKKCYT